MPYLLEVLSLNRVLRLTLFVHYVKMTVSRQITPSKSIKVVNEYGIWRSRTVGSLESLLLVVRYHFWTNYINGLEKIHHNLTALLFWSLWKSINAFIFRNENLSSLGTLIRAKRI